MDMPQPFSLEVLDRTPFLNVTITLHDVLLFLYLNSLCSESIMQLGLSRHVRGEVRK